MGAKSLATPVLAAILVSITHSECMSSTDPAFIGVLGLRQPEPLQCVHVEGLPAHNSGSTYTNTLLQWWQRDDIV